MRGGSIAATHSILSADCMMDPITIPRTELLPHHYFVDESGDGVIFDSKGRETTGHTNK